MPPVLADIDWNTLLQQPDLLPMIVFFGIGGTIALTAIIAVQWRKSNQSKYDAHLKNQMIDRGFSADEIVSVINAGGARGRSGNRANRVTCAEFVKG